MKLLSVKTQQYYRSLLEHIWYSIFHLRIAEVSLSTSGIDMVKFNHSLLQLERTIV